MPTLLLSYWCYSLRFVSGGATPRLCSALVGLSSTCYRSNSHNYLAATGDTQGFLAIPAFK